MLAIIFPGQGSQFIGMGKDFYDNYEITREIFEEISEITKINLKDIIFENQENKLNITEFTQIIGDPFFRNFRLQLERNERMAK